MPRRPLLEFEKPLVELEQQIEHIRQLARDSRLMSVSSCISWRALPPAGVRRSSEP